MDAVILISLTALNNREVAALLWLGVVVLFMLSRGDTRSAMGGLLSAAVQPAILLSAAALAGFAAALVLLASEVGLWEPELMKETCIWFIGIGLGLLMNIGRASGQDGWFRREVSKAVRITVFVTFFVNLAVFGLVVELLLLPFLAALGMMSAFAESQEELRPAKSVTDGLLGLTGIALFIYVVVRLATDWQSFNNVETVQTLVLPVWLTVGVLPFVYALGVWAAYQSAFGLINHATPRRRTRTRAKIGLLVELHIRVQEVGRFNPFAANTLGHCGSLRDARSAARKFRAGLEAERRWFAEQEDCLHKYAGVPGTDEEGAQLDQREFAETKEALQYFAMAQSGWYTNRETRYRSDLLPLLAPFDGLPEDHGISVKVSRDGQSWWAWRRTVTGWCFAIGAAGPPPDEWLYDGPEPPNGFPGKDPAWGERWGLDAPNWMSAGPTTLPSEAA